MPRFRTLSEAITTTIDEQVPRLNFPDGSVLNQQVGRIPHLQESNFLRKDESFRWGFSTWGLESITTKYKPEQ